MQKFLVSVLLIMLLSVVILGCKDEEEDPAELSEAAKNYLSANGVNDFPIPDGGDFHGFKELDSDGAPGVLLAWENANEALFNSYLAKFNLSRAAAFTEIHKLNVTTVNGFSYASFTFYGGEGNNGGTLPDTGGYTVPDNSIVFIGWFDD